VIHLPAAVAATSG